MTTGRVPSAPKLFCLHVLHLLHNVKLYTMYKAALLNKVTANAALEKVLSSMQSEKYISNLAIKAQTVSPFI